MYADDKNTNIVVQISNVDVYKNQIHCSAKDGGKFVLRMPISNGMYRIPKTGETWIIRRKDLTNWYFEGIINIENLYGNSLPLDGDIILDSGNNVNISAKGVFINNAPIGTPFNEEFDIQEEEGVITLSETPLPESVQVFNNGLLIAPSGIIIREQTLLFADPLSIGKVVVYYTRVPQR